MLRKVHRNYGRIFADRAYLLSKVCDLKGKLPHNQDAEQWLQGIKRMLVMYRRGTAEKIQTHALLEKEGSDE